MLKWFIAGRLSWVVYLGKRVGDPSSLSGRGGELVQEKRSKGPDVPGLFGLFG
jgi:hypothetical protein